MNPLLPGVPYGTFDQNHRKEIRMTEASMSRYTIRAYLRLCFENLRTMEFRWLKVKRALFSGGGGGGGPCKMKSLCCISVTIGYKWPKFRF